MIFIPRQYFLAVLLSYAALFHAGCSSSPSNRWIQHSTVQSQQATQIIHHLSELGIFRNYLPELVLDRSVVKAEHGWIVTYRESRPDDSTEFIVSTDVKTHAVFCVYFPQRGGHVVLLRKYLNRPDGWLGWNVPLADCPPISSERDAINASELFLNELGMDITCYHRSVSKSVQIVFVPLGSNRLEELKQGREQFVSVFYALFHNEAFITRAIPIK